MPVRCIKYAQRGICSVRAFALMMAYLRRVTFSLSFLRVCSLLLPPQPAVPSSRPDPTRLDSFLKTTTTPPAAYPLDAETIYIRPNLLCLHRIALLSSTGSKV